MQNTSVSSVLSHLQIPRQVLFSSTTFFQEYQRWNDIQNKVLLAHISWSLARKCPWSIQYSQLLLSWVSEEKLQIKYFFWFYFFFFAFCIYLPFDKLSAGSQCQWFYWQHLPSVFSCGIAHLFTHRTISSQQMQVVRNFCFLAVFNSCKNLTLQHAQRADIFNIFLIYSSCFGWTRELLAPLFPFLVLRRALNMFPARLIYFFLQRASENLFHFQNPNCQIPNFFWTMSLYTSFCISSYPKAG